MPAQPLAVRDCECLPVVSYLAIDSYFEEKLAQSAQQNKAAGVIILVQE
jgi:hypothetical protein